MDPVQPAAAQVTQELGPERLGLAVADGAAQDLAVAVSTYSGGDHHRLGHDPEGVSRIFVAEARKLALPRIRLHDLRHNWATLALQNGVHPKVVQERLGHASITITLQICSHVIPTMHDPAADLVAGLIGSAADSNVVPLRRAVDGR